MKKSLALTLTSIITCMLIAGCSVNVQKNDPAVDTAKDVTVPEIKEANDEIEVSTEDNSSSEGESETLPDDNPKTLSEDPEPKAIVWLGDSLTQGSLGEKDDNLANAPYEKLKEMVDVPVEGYGLYGYSTHDIFWLYTDEGHYNQKVDPEKTYILWVGSNDWVVSGEPNSNTSRVIEEIDAFLNRGGGISNYIVMGTTSRVSLGDLYIPINNDLKAHYNEHYMDVIDIINKYGYSPDGTHLSQESYDAIAAAVYEKLKSLDYI